MLDDVSALGFSLSIFFMQFIFELGIGSAGTVICKGLLAVEVHAELVFAESLLLRAMLSFVQDENLMSFIKGALKIKTCYQSYK